MAREAPTQRRASGEWRIRNGEWRIRKAKTIVPTKKLSVDARSDKGDCGVSTHGIEAFNLGSKIGIFQFSSPALVPSQGKDARYQNSIETRSFDSDFMSDVAQKAQPQGSGEALAEGGSRRVGRKRIENHSSKVSPVRKPSTPPCSQ